VRSSSSVPDPGLVPRKKGAMALSQTFASIVEPLGKTYLAESYAESVTLQPDISMAVSVVF
jgi:hypothetical protein